MNNNRNFNPAVCAAVHKVRPGETLYGIARDYNTDYQRLMMLNGITNPSNIAIGQEICIPHGGSAAGGSSGNTGTGMNGTNIRPRPDRPSPGPQQRPANRMHTIATGDTLYGISRNYGVSLASLMSCNPGIDPYNLQVGSKLTVPPAPRPAAAAPRVSDADNNTTTTTPSAPTQQASASQASTPQTIASQPAASSDIRTATANSTILDTMTDNSANHIITAAPETTNNRIQNSEHESSEITYTDMNTAVNTSHADGIIHTVGENESITDILTQFNVCYHALLHENPGTDFTSDITGLSICIPYDDVFAKNPENQPYIVKSGDTLMTISETSGIPSDDLLRMNPCCNILHFSTPGTRLRI